jgi:hypothetical protein
MKQVSSLESQVSDLMAKIRHLEECDFFLIEIIESACEQLQCEFSLKPSWAFCCAPLILYAKICNFAGSCLNPVDENRRVSEQIPTLFGLIRVIATPSFFCMIVLNISEKQSMVVKNL